MTRRCAFAGSVAEFNAPLCQYAAGCTRPAQLGWLCREHDQRLRTVSDDIRRGARPRKTYQ